MIIAVACLIAIAVIAFILGVRPKDLPAPEPESPFQHLDERKAAIYENLRDLQFEYRLGKLSDADYQQTKGDLQKELAGVLAEVDRVRDSLNLPKPAKAAITKATIPQHSRRSSPRRPRKPPRAPCRKASSRTSASPSIPCSPATKPKASPSCSATS